MDNTHNNNMSSKQIPSEGNQPTDVQLSVAPGSGSSVNGKDHKIFVGCLSIDTTDASLSAYFSKFGKVENCKVVRHVKNKHSRCFGFVTFVCTQTAAIISGGPHTIDGKVVDVKQMENQQPKNKLGNKRTRKNTQSRGESKAKGIKQEVSKKEVDEKRGTNKKKDVLENIPTKDEQVQNTSDIPSEGELDAVPHVIQEYIWAHIPSLPDKDDDTPIAKNASRNPRNNAYATAQMQ
ncbi:hypothetical protein niasHT_039150 [Heterodera trifolii]|uniref:RRM domain-containing protein n=1 Tax=Heterodera trifolii TaxID=157864 RepID=A0ABD2ICU1_9BILA